MNRPYQTGADLDMIPQWRAYCVNDSITRLISLAIRCHLFHYDLLSAARNKSALDETTARVLFDTARIITNARWNMDLLLLMPDHLHALIGIDGHDCFRADSRLQKNYCEARRRRMATKFL